jgi:hypothetical protein
LEKSHIGTSRPDNISSLIAVGEVHKNFPLEEAGIFSPLAFVILLRLYVVVLYN